MSWKSSRKAAKLFGETPRGVGRRRAPPEVRDADGANTSIAVEAAPVADGANTARRFSTRQMAGRGWHKEDRLVWCTSAQLTGSPRVYPAEKESALAWSPTDDDTLVVTCDETIAQQIWIFETHAAGAILTVEDRHGEALLWRDEPKILAGAQVLVVTLASPCALTGVRITFERRKGAQIDAVAIMRDGPPSNEDVDWRTAAAKKPRRPISTIVVPALLALFTAAIVFYGCAPSDLVAGERAGVRVSYGNDFANVRWSKGPRFFAPEKGPQITSREYELDGETSAVVLHESRAGAVVRVDDVTTSWWPVVLYRGTGADRVASQHTVRLDLPQRVRRVRVLVDATNTPGAGVIAVGAAQ